MTIVSELPVEDKSALVLEMASELAQLVEKHRCGRSAVHVLEQDLRSTFLGLTRFGGDLVYLMGGESLDYEIAVFPRLGKRMIRLKDEVTIYDLAAGKPFRPPDT